MTKQLVHIDVVGDGACAVVHVLGDIDLKNAPVLRAAIADLIERKRYDQVIIDLSSVAHIDSSGVGTLIEAWRTAHRVNARMIIAGLNDGPRRFLDVTRLDRVLEVTPTASDALRKLG